MFGTAIAALGIALALPSIALAQDAPDARTIVDGLAFPTAIAFDDRGRMYVNERSGRIRVVVGGRLAAEPVAEIPTTTVGETGLLGLAVSPDGASLYTFATDPGGQINRVWRVPIAGGDPRVVVDSLPANVYHNGGGVAFAPDGTLLVSNGETHDSSRAQDPSALGGKVYRYTADGDVPPDNPFGDSPAYAIGLRNPFGLTLDPVSGAAFVTENGPSEHDEVNRIDAGGNYGWPEFSGPAGGADASGLVGEYSDPLVDHPEIIVPTGIAVADPSNAQKGYAGNLFFGSYGEGTVHRVRLNGARDEAISDEIFVTDGSPVVAVAWGPEGLYYSTTEAVKVVDIAGRGPRSGTTDERSPSPTAAEASPSPAASGRDRGSSFIPRAIVFALLAAAGIYFYRRSRPA